MINFEEEKFHNVGIREWQLLWERDVAIGRLQQIKLLNICFQSLLLPSTKGRLGLHFHHTWRGVLGCSMYTGGGCMQNNQYNVFISMVKAIFSKGKNLSRIQTQHCLMYFERIWCPYFEENYFQCIAPTCCSYCIGIGCMKQKQFMMCLVTMKDYNHYRLKIYKTK